MATTTSAAGKNDTTLEIRRVLPAPRTRVFDAWTQAKELDRWSAPAPMTPRTEVDLRVGGSYRIAMTGPDGITRRVSGVYRVIDRPSKLVYTWKWEESPMPESLLTIEFLERGKSTEVILRHEGLADADSRGRHEHGWSECLNNLVAILER